MGVPVVVVVWVVTHEGQSAERDGRIDIVQESEPGAGNPSRAIAEGLDRCRAGPFCGRGLETRPSGLLGLSAETGKQSRLPSSNDRIPLAAIEPKWVVEPVDSAGGVGIICEITKP